jgi:hypothetical protein
MLVLLIMLVVGVISRKAGITDDVGNKKLSRLLINVCQSAMMLSSVMNSETELSITAVFKIIGVSMLLYVLLIAFSYLVPLVLHAPRQDRKLYRFMSIFGNVGFMGFPVISSIFGSEAVFYASLFNIPFNLLMYTLGISLASGEGVQKEKLSIKSIFNVPLVATLVSLAIFLLHIQFPYAITEATSMLGDMVVPAAMIVIGTSLGGMSLKKMLGNWRLYIFTPIKLIVLPIVVYYLFGLFVHDEMVLGIATVMAALPVATNCTMLCLEYGGNEDLASSATFMTTVLSVATIPLIVYLLLI